MRFSSNYFLISIIIALEILFWSVLPCCAKELILYSHLTDGYWQLWSMNPDGSEKTQITFSESDKREPAWIQDAQKVLFRTNNSELFIVDLNGKNEHKIFQDFARVNNPQFSNVSNQLFFVSFFSKSTDSSDIWRSNIDRTDKMMLTHDKILKYHPAVSADGKRIAFIKDSRRLKKSHNIWVMDADGENQTQLTFGPGIRTRPAFSSDGRSILFSSNERSPRNYDIYSVSLEGRSVKPVIISEGLDTFARYSPDGKKIIFVSNRNGSQQLWIKDQGGKSPVPLTNGPDESVDPVWITLKDAQEMPQ